MGADIHDNRRVIKAAANSTDYFLNICLCQTQCWVFVWCISDCLEDQLNIPFLVELAEGLVQSVVMRANPLCSTY